MGLSAVAGQLRAADAVGEVGLARPKASEDDGAGLSVGPAPAVDQVRLWIKRRIGNFICRGQGDTIDFDQCGLDWTGVDFSVCVVAPPGERSVGQAVG